MMATMYQICCGLEHMHNGGVTDVIHNYRKVRIADLNGNKM